MILTSFFLVYKKNKPVKILLRLRYKDREWGKKKPCDTELRRRQSSYGQTYTTRTSTGNARKNWGMDVERTTTGKVFFFFFQYFLRSGYEIWISFWEIWLDWFLFRYMGYIRFWFDFLKFGVIYGLGLERARQRNKREREFAIWKEHW